MIYISFSFFGTPGLKFMWCVCLGPFLIFHAFLLTLPVAMIAIGESLHHTQPNSRSRIIIYE